LRSKNENGLHRRRPREYWLPELGSNDLRINSPSIQTVGSVFGT